MSKLQGHRDMAEATGATSEEGKKLLWGALDVVGRGMQSLRDHGWDEKTPSVPDSPTGSKLCGCSCGCKCGCKCGCDCTVLLLQLYPYM